MSAEEENLMRCSNVPSSLLNEDDCYQHFQKFGEITRLEITPQKNEVLIGFKKITGALNAMSKGNSFEGKSFTMDLQSSPPKPKKKRIRKTVALPEGMDDDLKSELMAMGGYVESEPGLSELLRKKKKIEKKLKRTYTENLSSVKVKKSSAKSDNVNSEQRELLSIMEKSAATEEEKFKVLEARDKLLRLIVNKKQNISITKRTIGTCPDMCPEKERLMRVFQHQVSFFEQDEESRAMNHSLAVKQYSRSSADQESPLPHELRNVEVLEMTMGYLMHEIMDLCNDPETNLGDWFHFLWDRTRALRKDITQQELCCNGSVEIIEQCARFHIFCSARLVAEEPMVFDQKINTENLTKCLQTLKYFYDDLALKNQDCPNEPEFRAYIILLNLNDGVIMWEIQHLKPAVQKSPEVRFALAACSALQKNNYVKFFKLVRSTTFLNACILLRYFVQLRLKALIVKVKSSLAYRTPPVPIIELQDMLGFEDFESTVDFFNYYGLPINEDKTHIVFDKQYYSLPDTPFTLERAQNLIESKIDRSIGEIICGKNLPAKKFESHVPENSFNNDGYLINSKLPNKLEFLINKKPSLARERSKSPLVTEINSSEGIFDTNMDANSQTSIFGGGDLKGSFSKPESSVKNENKHDNTNVFKKLQSSLFDNNSKPNANIFGNKLFINKSGSDSIFNTKAESTVEPEKPKSSGGFFFKLTDKNLIAKENELKIKQKQEMQMKMIQEQKQRDYEESERIKMEAIKKQEEIERKILLEKSRMVEIEKRRQREMEVKRKEEMERKKMELQKQLWEMENERKLRLVQIEKQKALEEMQRKKLLKELQIQKRREREEMLRNAEIKRDVSIVMESMLKAVEEDYKRDKLNNLRYRYLARFVISRWRKKVASNKRKRKAIDQSPMWVIAKTLKETAKDFCMDAQDITLNLMKRYKLGLPININTNFHTVDNKINLFELTYADLCRNLQLLNDIYWKVNIFTNKNSKLHGLINDVLNSYINWENNCYLEQRQVGVHSVHYCLEKTLQINENNGLIFISDELNENLFKIIFDTVNNLTESIPVSIIIQKSLIDVDLIDNLIDTEKISSYEIFTSNFLKPNLLNSINAALKFLAVNAKPPPDLQLNLLQNFLVENMGDLWNRISSFAMWNEAYKKCLSSPKIVIGLYNEALGRIKDLVFTDNCYDHNHFSPIFKELLPNKLPNYLPCDYKFFPSFWKDPMYKVLIDGKINLLKLPPYDFEWPPRDQSELEINIFNYCENLFKKPEEVFYRIMASILKNFHPDFMCDISWLDIIKVLSNEKIKELNYKPSVEFFDSETFEDVFIIYETAALKIFQSDAWFYLTNPLIINQVSENLKEIPEEENLDSSHRNVDEYDVNLDDTLREIAANWDFDDVIADRKVEFEKVTTLMEDLEESISLQKKTSLKFQSLLEKILQDK